MIRSFSTKSLVLALAAVTEPVRIVLLRVSILVTGADDAIDPATLVGRISGNRAVIDCEGAAFIIEPRRSPEPLAPAGLWPPAAPAPPVAVFPSEGRVGDGQDTRTGGTAAIIEDGTAHAGPAATGTTGAQAVGTATVPCTEAGVEIGVAGSTQGRENCPAPPPPPPKPPNPVEL